MKIVKKEDIIYLYCILSLFVIFSALKILLGVSLPTGNFLLDLFNFFSDVIEGIMERI